MQNTFSEYLETTSLDRRAKIFLNSIFEYLKGEIYEEIAGKVKLEKDFRISLSKRKDLEE